MLQEALGAFAMAGHVFLDGLALGVAFTIDEKLGIAVFVALLVHAFSDGLNTVSLLIKSGKWTRKGIWLIGVDSIARISGAAVGSSLALSEDFTALYLATFCWNSHLSCNKSYPCPRHMLAINLVGRSVYNNCWSSQLCGA